MHRLNYAAAFVLAAAASAPSGAQDRAPSASVDALEEITVTGSRITRKDYVANSPITTVSGDAINATGAVTIEAALNQLPQFTIGANQTNAGFGGTGRHRSTFAG